MITKHSDQSEKQNYDDDQSEKQYQLWWPSWTGASIREWPESVRVTKGTQLELQVASKHSPNSNFIKCTLFYDPNFFAMIFRCSFTCFHCSARPRGTRLQSYPGSKRELRYHHHHHHHCHHYHCHHYHCHHCCWQHCLYTTSVLFFIFAHQGSRPW